MQWDKMSPIILFNTMRLLIEAHTQLGYSQLLRHLKLHNSYPVNAAYPVWWQRYSYPQSIEQVHCKVLASQFTSYYD